MNGGAETAKLGSGQLVQGVVGLPMQLTISERLTERKAQLERDLADVETAIQALEASPDVRAAVDAISKLHML